MNSFKYFYGLLLWVLMTPALANDVPEWNELTPLQQKTLQPLQNRWDTMTDVRRIRLLRGVERWAQLSPQDRADAKKRLTFWKGLNAKKKALIRDRYQKFLLLPPEAQEKIRKKYIWFRNLPAGKRRALKDRWRKLSPQQRRNIIERRIKMRQRLQHRRTD